MHKCFLNDVKRRPSQNSLAKIDNILTLIKKEYAEKIRAWTKKIQTLILLFVTF